MRYIAMMALTLFWSSLALASVINVEFKFTPFTGDPAKKDQVETVAGRAKVFINNVLLADQEVTKQTVPVLFEEREIASSVWVPVAGIGPRLRKGKNIIRIEFKPENGKTPYSAQLRWALVTDHTTTEDKGGRYKATNQSGEGVETKAATGTVVFEREFVADFAADLPWHHYPPVTTLSNEDKQRIATLINERAKAFKPNFGEVYRLLEGKENIQLAEIRKAKCLDKAYAVGIRVGAPPPDQLEFVTTGNAEVVVQRRGGDLYSLGAPEQLERLKGDELQMCVGMTLFMTYPPRLAVVRTPSGDWQVVY
jgi:hypothetical protein